MGPKTKIVDINLGISAWRGHHAYMNTNKYLG